MCACCHAARGSSLRLPCVQGNYGEARVILERALAIRKEKLGEEHEDTMVTLAALKELHESQHAQVGDLQHFIVLLQCVYKFCTTTTNRHRECFAGDRGRPLRSAFCVRLSDDDNVFSVFERPRKPLTSDTLTINQCPLSPATVGSVRC